MFLFMTPYSCKPYRSNLPGLPRPRALVRGGPAARGGDESSPAVQGTQAYSYCFRFFFICLFVLLQGAQAQKDREGKGCRRGR